MVAASSSLDLPGVAVRKTRPGATRVPGVEPRSRQLRMLPKSDSPPLSIFADVVRASTSEPDDARGRDRRRGVDLATRDAAMDDESTALMSASRSRRAGALSRPSIDRSGHPTRRHRSLGALMMTREKPRIFTNKVSVTTEPSPVTSARSRCASRAGPTAPCAAPRPATASSCSSRGSPGDPRRST